MDKFKNVLRGNEKKSLETLESWLPIDKDHTEYEKILKMIEAKKELLESQKDKKK